MAVPIADDSILEGLQSFSLELSALSPGVVVDDTPATVVIEDNDGQWHSSLISIFQLLTSDFQCWLLGLRHQWCR